jgi:hypothetical protein
LVATIELSAREYKKFASRPGLSEEGMRFLGWYLKIAAGGAAIGAAMELFMIHTGFCASLLLQKGFFFLLFVFITAC